MNPNPTARAIVFAALAAALAPVVWHLLALPGTTGVDLGPVGRPGLLAAGSRLAWVWIGLAGGYAFLTFSVAPSTEPGPSERGGARAARRRSLAAALAVALAGAAALAIGWTPFAVLTTCALGLAALRMSTGRSAAGLRGALLEGAVFFGSLWLAHWLGRAFGAGPIGFAASVWGFFLVQSLCLVGASAVHGPRRAVDAFEVARRRLEALLTDHPV